MDLQALFRFGSSNVNKNLQDKAMSNKEIIYVPEKTIHKWATLIGLVAANRLI